MDWRSRLPLGQTEWTLWTAAELRTPGFPAPGLNAFTSPKASAAADAMLAEDEPGKLRDAFEDAFAEAMEATDLEVHRIIGDPLFREALVWQNPDLFERLASGLSSRSGTRRRQRVTVARYWQRYCGKNETIGFFGPQLPVQIDGSSADVRAKPGTAMIRDSRVWFEWWALAACADALAGMPGVRESFAPRLAPHLHLAGREVLRPAQPPLALTTAELAAVRCCDGRSGAAVVADLVADHSSGVRTSADGYLLLHRLVEAGVLNWDADLPLNQEAERVLRARVAAIEDEGARTAAEAAIAPVFTARDEVVARSGDPSGLHAALADVDKSFRALTDHLPRRRGGQTYAGRTVLYQDSVRDLDVRIPVRILDEIAEPLAVLLRAARWFTVALAREYEGALRELYGELAADGAPVALADLWYLAQGHFWGSGTRPVERVAAEFRARWKSLFNADEQQSDTQVHTYTAAELAERAERIFDATGPGWSAGRLHSPDLQICAESVEAINRGDYTVVLGELHAAWATLDSSTAIGWHPDVAQMRRLLAEDIGQRRIRLLYPTNWPRRTGRHDEMLGGPGDYQLAFTNAPGADAERLLPATALTVTEFSGALVATASDGKSWPLVEVFSALLCAHAVDGFKLAAEGRHTPRISVDRLVVLRETWRFTVAELDVTGAQTDGERFIAMRRFRLRHGLPERAFVRLGTETKPTYLDFTAPVHCASVAQMLRSARLAGGEDVTVVFSELMPTPEQAWVPDAAGNRYFSELRLHAVDSEGAP